MMLTSFKSLPWLNSTQLWWATPRVTCVQCVDEPWVRLARLGGIFSSTRRTDTLTALSVEHASRTPVTSTGVTHLHRTSCNPKVCVLLQSLRIRNDSTIKFGLKAAALTSEVHCTEVHCTLYWSTLYFTPLYEDFVNPIRWSPWSKPEQTHNNRKQQCLEGWSQTGCRIWWKNRWGLERQMFEI